MSHAAKPPALSKRPGDISRQVFPPFFAIHSLQRAAAGWEDPVTRVVSPATIASIGGVSPLPRRRCWDSSEAQAEGAASKAETAQLMTFMFAFVRWI